MAGKNYADRAAAQSSRSAAAEATLFFREQERAALERAYAKPGSQLVVISGRLGTGKSALVEGVFKGRFTFRLSGHPSGGRSLELKHFQSALREQGAYLKASFNNWDEALAAVTDLIERSHMPRKVLFVDEISRLDTPRAGFLSAFEYWWNSALVPKGGHTAHYRLQ